MCKLNPRSKLQIDNVSVVRAFPDSKHYMLSKREIVGKLERHLHRSVEGRISEHSDYGEPDLSDRSSDTHPSNLFARDSKILLAVMGEDWNPSRILS